MKFICNVGKCRQKPRVFDTLEALLKHILEDSWWKQGHADSRRKP